MPKSRAQRLGRGRAPEVRQFKSWELIVDRMEHVSRHGNFRVVATAEKVHAQLPGEARWKVLVSLWKMEAAAANDTPEMIRLEDRRAADLDEALSDGVAVAVRRINEREG